MKFPERMLLKLPEGSLARIDAVAGKGGRSEWVRGLIEAGLNGGVNNSSSGSAKSSAPQSRSQNLNAGAQEKKPTDRSGKWARVEPGGNVSRRPAVVKRWGREFPLSPDAEALLGLVRERGHVSVKVAGEVLGWFEGRVGKAERVLLSLGLITSVSGFLYEAGDGEG